MRYANGLLKEGKKLLHWLTLIFLIAYILNIVLIWPVKAVWKGTYFMDTVKGKFCMKVNLTSDYGNEDGEKFWNRNKLINVSHILLLFGFTHFYFFSSLKIKYEKHLSI